MSNNIIGKYCMAVCGAMLLAASGEIAAQAPKPAAKPTVTPEAKPSVPVTPERQRKFDASKPAFTLSSVDEAIAKFKDTVLSKSLPKDTKEENIDNYITKLNMIANARMLEFYAKHPDLEEVTGVSREWYENLLPGVEKYMMDLANRMDLARLNQDNKKYEQAKAAFEASQKDFLEYLSKTPGPKLSKEAMKKIKQANYKRREKEYDEQIKKAQPAGK